MKLGDTELMGIGLVIAIAGYYIYQRLTAAAASAASIQQTANGLAPMVPLALAGGSAIGTFAYNALNPPSPITS